MRTFYFIIFVPDRYKKKNGKRLHFQVSEKHRW